MPEESANIIFYLFMSLTPLVNIERKLRRVSKNSYKELSLTFRLSSDEYTQEIEELFFTLFETWKPVRLILAQEVEEAEDPPPIEPQKERDPRAKKLQQLALNIKAYAIQHQTNEQTVKEALYKLYEVNSRSELTDEQLDLALVKCKPLHPSELEYYRDQGFLA